MSEQTVLVTGGTSGIGLSVAIYLRYMGYKVYASSRNPDRYDLKGLEPHKSLKDDICTFIIELDGCTFYLHLSTVRDRRFISEVFNSALFS